MSVEDQPYGIKKLMSAVIWQSIVDYVNIGDTDSLYLSAERWLFTDSFRNDYSFRSLCENLNYDFKLLRVVAIKLRKGGVKIRQNGRQLVNLTLFDFQDGVQSGQSVN